MLHLNGKSNQIVRLKTVLMITLAILGRTTESYAFSLLIFLNVDRHRYANRVQRNSHPQLT